MTAGFCGICRCCRMKSRVRFYENLSDNVFLLKLIPGISPVLLPAIFEHYDAIIVESFGVGGIPASIKEPFYELCQKYPEKLIIMCTQVSHEGSDMTVYEVGHEMKNPVQHSRVIRYDLRRQSQLKPCGFSATVRMIMRAGKKHSINRSTTIRSGNKKRKTAKRLSLFAGKKCFCWL